MMCGLHGGDCACKWGLRPGVGRVAKGWAGAAQFGVVLEAVQANSAEGAARVAPGLVEICGTGRLITYNVSTAKLMIYLGAG